MLTRVVAELNDQQVFALSAAPDAVDLRNMGAFGSCFFQYIVHLCVGGVCELDDGAGFFKGEVGSC